MFEVYCPAHRSAVLLTSGRITALHNDPDGVRIEWRCWCGHAGHSLGGRRSAGPGSHGTHGSRGDHAGRPAA